MDPLSALSLATSVVQFVDFTSRLLAGANEVRSAGQAVDVQYMQKTADDLRKFTGPFRNVQDTNKSSDQDLVAIAGGCEDVAEELSTVLEGLSRRSDRKTWNNLLTALRTMMAKDQIERLQARLDNFRQQLSLRLIASVNAKIDERANEQSEQLRDLRQSLERTTKSISRVVQISIFTQSPDSIQRPLTGVSEFHSLGEDLTAILKRDNGTSEFVDMAKLRDPRVEVSVQPDAQRVVTFAASQQSHKGLEEAHSIRSETFATLATRVMNLLSYPVIHMRKETIAENHKKTFEWILQRQDPEVHYVWDDFASWLQRETSISCPENSDASEEENELKPIYWIHGKPGSGKSTLMKFVVESQLTHELLNQWKGHRRLVTASFFFWALGTGLQKSQVGLIRSLLVQVLDKHPSLIPQVLPNICSNILQGSTQTFEVTSVTELTLFELKMAFLRLLQCTRETLSICLFIDGLDEFDGDLQEICEFLMKITSSSSNLKLVISSRPWNILRDTFKDSPKLALQDLTRHDIEAYIIDKLELSPGLKSLVAVEPGSTETITRLMCERASGVFLWVYLALRSVLEGLMNADSLNMVVQRIDSLPADLEALYRVIFDSLDLETRRRAARDILIVLSGSELQVESPISPLQLHLAESATIEDAISTETGALSGDELQAIHDLTRRRLEARAKGLLEVYGEYGGTSKFSAFDTHVTFMHRTAADYFRTKEMDDMLGALVDKYFSPDVQLTASCLLELKKLQPRQIIYGMDRIMRNLYSILAHIANLEEKFSYSYFTLAGSVDNCMKQHWSRAKAYQRIPIDGHLVPREYTSSKTWEVAACEEIWARSHVPRHSLGVLLRPTFRSALFLEHCYRTLASLVIDETDSSDEAEILYELLQHFAYSPDFLERIRNNLIGAIVSLVQSSTISTDVLSILYRKFIYRLQFLSKEDWVDRRGGPTVVQATGAMQILRSMIEAGAEAAHKPSLDDFRRQAHQDFFKDNEQELHEFEAAFEEYESLVEKHSETSSGRFALSSGGRLRKLSGVSTILRRVFRPRNSKLPG